MARIPDRGQECSTAHPDPAPACRCQDQRSAPPPPSSGASRPSSAAGEAGHSAHPVTVTDATFDQLIRASQTPVLVDFWAEWCGPCKMIAPAVADLAREFAGRAVVGKLNVDREPAHCEPLRRDEHPHAADLQERPGRGSDRGRAARAGAAAAPGAAGGVIRHPDSSPAQIVSAPAVPQPGLSLSNPQSNPSPFSLRDPITGTRVTYLDLNKYNTCKVFA